MVNDAVLKTEIAKVKDDFVAIVKEVSKVIVGQERVIECAVTTLIAGGNLLLEGVPGLGKTELVKALSKVLQLDSKRIQFTPDLMPADIIGTKVMNSDQNGHYQFEFRKGPIFTQLLLADEINRATPKTQSALLETMQEHSVTADGTTYQLKLPFFVMATQNPIEQEGTYNLPEAQLDRFMFKINVPFLSRDEMNEVLQRTIIKEAVEVNKIVDGERILAMRKILNMLVIADPIRDFAVRIVLASHPDSEFAPDIVKKFVRWGASPRAAQALLKASRVRAISDGRVHVSFQDISYFAREVLQHRVLLNYDGQAENIKFSDVVNAILAVTPELLDKK